NNLAKGSSGTTMQGGRLAVARALGTSEDPTANTSLNGQLLQPLPPAHVLRETRLREMLADSLLSTSIRTAQKTMTMKFTTFTVGTTGVAVELRQSLAARGEHPAVALPETAILRKTSMPARHMRVLH